MPDFPTTVGSDDKGAIHDFPGLIAAGRSGREIRPLDPAQLIPLPNGSWLYFLPGRLPLAFKGNTLCSEDNMLAVAAFLPPGYVALSLSAFKAEKNAPALPLFCYCAVCWYRNEFYVPALRVDDDPKHDLSCVDMNKVYRKIDHWIRKHPNNRLVAHHGLKCVKQYGCPNAVNLFLRRWEAPVAVSGHCNAKCLGCISDQAGKTVKAPQERIDFEPTVEEIVEIAVPHLKKAQKAIISFGQGCEGEPLLKSRLIESAISVIRAKTGRGTLHLNTNGSLPEAVKRLAGAGLDSIRISINSARPKLYAAYYRCRGYSFNNVMESFRVARRSGLRVSINYLTFPGVTDDPEEFNAFCGILEEIRPQMIQWRNLNIDPDLYMRAVAGERADKPASTGILPLMEKIHEKFPQISFGYFNRPVEDFQRCRLRRS